MVKMHLVLRRKTHRKIRYMWKGQREKIRCVISTKPNVFLSVYNWVKKLEFKVGPVLMSTFKRDRRLVVRFVQIYEIRFVIKKQVSMIKKYHNHTLQTNPRNHEEEPQDTNIRKATSGIQ